MTNVNDLQSKRQRDFNEQKTAVLRCHAMLSGRRMKA